jgi:hypothetical protein
VKSFHVAALLYADTLPQGTYTGIFSGTFLKGVPPEIVGGVTAFTYISVKPLSVKAFAQISVTELGMVTEVNFEQPIKLPCRREVIELERVTDVKLEQL